MRKRKVLWPNQVFVFLLLLVALSFPVQALAMSQDELRLRALEEKFAAQEKSFSWLKKFKPSGDLRLRQENLIREGDNGTGRIFSRSRQRIRFRIGGEYFFAKNLKVGFRLVTGSDDPISTNQTLVFFFVIRRFT